MSRTTLYSGRKAVILPFARSYRGTIIRSENVRDYYVTMTRRDRAECARDWSTICVSAY
jgi:hypothetical protein